jgi:poly-gamma-glutamate synthesis protein (capsule biosynthesis protein)
MLSRYVGTKIRKSGDMALPFRNIYNIFSEADISFINLEAPFYDQGDYVTEGMIFKSEPETIAGLNLAGIDIVSMANNHAKNEGQAGLLYSFNLLDENNIKYVGAGNDKEEAHQEKIIEKEGIKFAFLAYTYSDGINSKSSVTSDDPDVAFMDVVEMKKDVERATNKADVIVVSMHAGVEYQNYPNVEQEKFAREAIDAGANLVLGHHPHVVQSTEKYNNGFIIYSLGNLVFDQMWSQETQEGVIASCKFVNNNLKQIEFVPIKIENYNQPRQASDSESAIILKRMQLGQSIIDL